MKSEKSQFIQLKLSQLIVNKDNYRYSLDRYLNKHLKDESEAIKKFCDKDNKDKMLKLMKSIINNGIFKSQNFIVTKENSNHDKYVMLDGNRRLTAIKILDDPNLVPNKSKEIKDFAAKNQKNFIEIKFNCTEYFEPKDAKKEINFIHNPDHTFQS